MANPSADISHLDGLIARLSCSLTGEDVKSGWCEQARVGMLDYFRALRTDVIAGRPNPALVGVVRGLDAWGVLESELAEECLRVSKELRDAGCAE